MWNLKFDYSQPLYFLIKHCSSVEKENLYPKLRYSGFESLLVYAGCVT